MSIVVVVQGGFADETRSALRRLERAAVRDATREILNGKVDEGIAKLYSAQSRDLSADQRDRRVSNEVANVAIRMRRSKDGGDSRDLAVYAIDKLERIAGREEAAAELPLERKRSLSEDAYTMGMLYEDVLGDKEAARRCFERAVSLHQHQLAQERLTIAESVRTLRIHRYEKPNRNPADGISTGNWELRKASEED